MARLRNEENKVPLARALRKDGAVQKLSKAASTALLSLSLLTLPGQSAAQVQQSEKIPDVPSSSSINLGSQSDSKNWSGYFVVPPSHDSQFVEVSSRFRVPNISAGCETALGNPQAFEFSIWIGIGGIDENSLIQAGIRGVYLVYPNHSRFMATTPYTVSMFNAFYETSPDIKAQPVENFNVSSGDEINVRISRVKLDANLFHIQITNETTGQSYSKDVELPKSPKMSAEWIVESPLLISPKGVNLGYLPIPQFTPVTFNDVSAGVSSSSSPAVIQENISRLPYTRSNLSYSSDETNDSYQLASATYLSNDGSQFQVKYSYCTPIPAGGY